MSCQQSLNEYLSDRDILSSANFSLDRYDTMHHKLWSVQKSLESPMKSTLYVHAHFYRIGGSESGSYLRTNIEPLLWELDTINFLEGGY